MSYTLPLVIPIIFDHNQTYYFFARLILIDTDHDLTLWHVTIRYILSDKIIYVATLSYELMVKVHNELFQYGKH